MPRESEKSAAEIVINGAPEFSRRGRRAIARWMRQQARILEEKGEELSTRFCARYVYTPSKRKG